MLLHGGIYVSREAAVHLADVLERAESLCVEPDDGSMMDPDHPVVQLKRALVSAAISGLTPKSIRACLRGTHDK
jgi:hypothetical protein